MNVQIREIEEISIITTVYNHGDTIRDALDSILMQHTSRLFHVYCLNDASTDNSGAILEEYQKRHPDKITVFTNKINQGTGKKSILKNKPPVRGKYWTLLDGDDFWTASDKIEKQISILEKNPKSQGCSSHTVVRNEQTGEKSIIKPSFDRWNLMDLALGVNGLYVHPSSIIWRNTFLKKGNFFPRAFIQTEQKGDWLLLHMSLASGGCIVNYPEVTSCYRVTGRGVWTMLSGQEQDALNKNMRKFILAWLPLKYAIGCKVIKSQTLRKFAGIFPQPLTQ